MIRRLHETYTQISLTGLTPDGVSAATHIIQLHPCALDPAIVETDEPGVILSWPGLHDIHVMKKNNQIRVHTVTRAYWATDVDYLIELIDKLHKEGKLFLAATTA